MSNCSKAPRGLFVLLRTDGIFTVNALSPSSSSRQYPYHYAIRAGQNLPDKEFRSNLLQLTERKRCASFLHSLYVAIEFGLYLIHRYGF
jgi:hypothetical protein